MKQTSFRQARINENNKSSFYYTGQIVEVVKVLYEEKAVIIRANAHSFERKVGMDILDL